MLKSHSKQVTTLTIKQQRKTKRKKTKTLQNILKTKYEMAMANPYLSVIVINTNGSNYLIKGQRVAELSRNQSSNPHKTLY